MTPLEQLLKNGPPVGGSADQPIGVPPDYVVTRDRPGVRDSFGNVARKAKHQEVTPRYFEGDDWSPANLPPDQIWSVQQRMIAAGLIPKGAEIRKGYWDDSTRTAYRQLLGEANGAGFSADQQLTVRENSEAINKQRSQAASVYLRPDPATLRSTARDALQKALGEGHKATDQEVEHLASVLGGFTKQQYNASVAADDAANAASAAGDTTGPTTIQDVDPTARFEEYIRQQYRPEIKHNEQVVDMANSRNSLLGNVFTLDQMIGGPGR